MFKAKHPGVCEAVCRERISPGEDVIQKRVLGIMHAECYRKHADTLADEPSGGDGDPGIDSEDREKIAKLDTALRGLAHKIESLNPVPATLVIKQNGKSDITVDSAHKQFPLLLSLISFRENVYLYGAPGGGKSHAAQQAAQTLDLRYGYVSLNEQSPEYLILGYSDATGTYRPSLFRDFYENGGVFCIEELDNASGSLLTALNCALENGLASFPDGLVQRHPDFVMIGCGNTCGRGAHPAFPERRPFDAAFADRFFYVEWLYDYDLEIRIAFEINPGAAPYTEWVSRARTWCEENGIRIILSPRASFRLARLSTDKTVTDDILLNGVLKGIDTTARDKLLANHPFPTLRS